MGRPRKMLEKQTGNLTVAQKMQKQAEEAAISGASKELIMTPPKELRDKAARDTWERILPDLMSNELICNLDRDNLIGYCNAMSWYIECGKKLKRNKTVPKHTEIWFDRQLKAAAEQRRYGRLIGMDMDARLKIATIKISEQDEKLKEEFGDI